MSKDERGHTLLEVLVSVLLLGLALAALLQLYPSLVAANESQRDLAVLSAAASSKVEELGRQLRRKPPVPIPLPGVESCPLVPHCLVTWEVQTEATGTTPAAGALWKVQVTACVDADSSSTCEVSELQVRYETKVTSR